MRQLRWIGAAALLVLLMAAGAQAQTGMIRGEVRDFEGNPYPDVAVRIKSEETGQTRDLKTDKNGRFVQAGLAMGVYSVVFQVEHNGQPLQYDQPVRISGQQLEHDLKINFKELYAADAARAAKEAEEAKKFQDMKGQFDAGTAALDQAKLLRSQIPTAPPEQRAALQQQLGDAQQMAITSFQNALNAAPEKDPNRHLINAKLGEAYEAAARYEDAAAAYRRATELKPDQAAYFNNLGNTLARMGKVEEAFQAYERAAAVDPANAGMYYLNYGIVLYQLNRLKDAIEPLKKATEVNPRNPDGWYLLGAALVGGMEYKQEGDKITAIILPGTVEAYEKYLELAPNGRFAGEARAGLEMLASLGAGVQTKYRTGKKRN